MEERIAPRLDALAGPLNDATRANVEQLWKECLGELVTSLSPRAIIAV